MANAEKLGTCDDLNCKLHPKDWPEYGFHTCVNWREQPQEPSRGGTCCCYDGDSSRCPIHQRQTDADDLNGIVQGVEDMNAGRTKPIEQIRSELKQEPSRCPTCECPTCKSSQRLPTFTCFHDWHYSHPAASPRSGMGARETFAQVKQWGDFFVIALPKTTLYHFRTQKEAQHTVDVINRDVEAYAADQVRQADEGWREASAELEAEIAELRQERDDDEQMWRERCDAASKAGYEVAMEQEREARERAERALRDVEKQVTELVKIAAEVAHRRYLPDLEKARTIRNAREEVRRYDSYHMLLVARLKKVADSLRALAQVKSSEGTKGSS